jgi:hypothetical protein
MIRLPIQVTLCLILSPLLGAQQVSQPSSPSAAPPPQPEPAKQYVTLPGDTNIELLPPGPTTFAQERAGRVVRFVVDKDVVLGGVPVVHAGVPVVGVVDTVKRASHYKHRVAEMEIRVTEMVTGNPVEIHLRCFDSDDYSLSGYSQRQPGPGFGPVIAGVVAVAVALILLALGGDR